MHDRNFLYVFDNYFFAIYTAKALLAAKVNVFQYDQRASVLFAVVMGNGVCYDTCAATWGVLR